MDEDIYSVIDNKADRTGATGTTPERPAFDKDEYAARKKAEREGAYAMIDAAARRITDDPVAFGDYLGIVSRFPNHSVSNTLLIFEQRPDATRLADFDTWKRRGTPVRHGEGAIAILESGDEYTRDDGSIGVSINVRKVFDERQTSARHKEPRHPEMREVLIALIDNPLAEIKAVDGLPEHLGNAVFDNDSKTVLVTKGLSEKQVFSALCTELAHASLAKADKGYMRQPNHETALLAARVVLERFGVKGHGQVPVFSPSAEGGAAPDVKGGLERIRGAAKDIIGHVEGSLDKGRAQDAALQAKTASRGDRDAR